MGERFGAVETGERESAIITEDIAAYKLVKKTRGQVSFLRAPSLLELITVCTTI